MTLDIAEGGQADINTKCLKRFYSIHLYNFLILTLITLFFLFFPPPFFFPKILTTFYF